MYIQYKTYLSKNSSVQKISELIPILSSSEIKVSCFEGDLGDGKTSRTEPGGTHWNKKSVSINKINQ